RLHSNWVPLRSATETWRRKLASANRRNHEVDSPARSSRRPLIARILVSKAMGNAAGLYPNLERYLARRGVVEEFNAARRPDFWLLWLAIIANQRLKGTTRPQALKEATVTLLPMKLRALVRWGRLAATIGETGAAAL